MAKIIDITGQRFGRLVVLSITDQKELHRGRKWLCRCDCGNEVIITGSSLRSGSTRSCGCLKKESDKRTMKRIATKHEPKPEPEIVYPVVVNKEQFDDWWMFGEHSEIKRLRKMFY